VSARLPRPWRSLRGRLALGFLAGLLIASAVFTAVGSGLIRSESSRAARNELDRQAKAVGAIVSNQAEDAAFAGRCFRTYRVQNLENLLGRNTRLFYVGLRLCPGQKDNPAGGLPQAVASSVSQEALAENGVQRIDFTPPGSTKVTDASAAPIIVGGQPFGAVVLARPRGEFGAALGSVLQRVIIAAAIGAAVALAVVLLLTSRVTRPLRDMHMATARVARGDLRIALERGGPAELDDLAGAFNRMVAELAQRDAMAREFLMRVTHDLRTPLTAIRGHAAALADGIVPQEDVPRSLSAIEAETERLETMVDDLLDLAKLDAHRFRLELDEVEDPRELLEAAFGALETEAARQDVAYERTLAPLPPMVTDGQRVRQIVGNLLDNALRWTPEGGRVALEARPDTRGGLTVTVTDTGPGIPESEREVIFEPFRSNPTPDGRQGTGLGLAISRQLARALGGDLTAATRPEGGSRFTLSLPARAEYAAPALVAEG